MTRFDSITDYERYVYDLPNKHSQIQFSTLVVKRGGRDIAEVSESIFFDKQIQLNIRELIDFRKARLKTYSYEIFLDREKQYWYDDQPHPNDPSLQSTFPHHKHVPPDLKHHRIPAPGLSFAQPNLPFLIQEILDHFFDQNTEEKVNGDE